MGDSGIPGAALSGIALPLSAALEGEPDREGATHQPYVSLHLNLPTLGSNGYCLSQVQNSTRCLSEMLHSTNSKLELKLQRLKITMLRVKS